MDLKVSMPQGEVKVKFRGQLSMLDVECCSEGWGKKLRSLMRGSVSDLSQF